MAHRSSASAAAAATPATIPRASLRQRRKRRRHHYPSETSATTTWSFFCCLTFRVGSALALFSTVVYSIIIWYRGHSIIVDPHLVNLHAQVHQDWRTTDTTATSTSSHTTAAKKKAAQQHHGATTTSALSDDLELVLPRYDYNIFERKPGQSSSSSYHYDHKNLDQAIERLLADFTKTYTLPFVADDNTSTSSNQEPDDATSSRRSRAYEILASRVSGSPSLRLGQHILQRPPNDSSRDNAGQSGILTVWIAGSSAAAGYGNVKEHSYTKQFQTMLQPVLESLLFPGSVVRWNVVDTTTKDLTEFPSTWCFSPALVVSPVDVVVYDFGEEFSEPHVGRLEAFVRYILVGLTTSTTTTTTDAPPSSSHANNTNDSHRHDRAPPLLVVRGIRTVAQWKVLQHYAAHLPLLVIRDDLFGTTSPANANSSVLPAGFEAFAAFGNPASPDALHAHNLSVQQHRLASFLLALHVVSSLAVALDHPETSTSTGSLSLLHEESNQNRPRTPLPPSLFGGLEGQEALQTLFLTSEVANNRDLFIHCRTSYEHSALQIGNEGSSLELVYSESSNNNDTSLTLLLPAAVVSRPRLHDMIVDGLANPDHDVTFLLLPQTEQTAHRGWVLALDPESKRSKLLLRSTGDFLGFVDWKMAYYGVPQSGSLQFFVPLEDVPPATAASLELFVCQDDARRQNQAGCRLHRDATFFVQGQRVDGTPVTTNLLATSTTNSAGEPTCVQIRVDPTTLPVATAAAVGRSAGIHLNVTVTNPQITWRNGPCSVAYIVWTTRTVL